MVLEFSPESGIGPEDVLEVFVTPPSLPRGEGDTYNPMVSDLKMSTFCCPGHIQFFVLFLEGSNFLIQSIPLG